MLSSRQCHFPSVGEAGKSPLASCKLSHLGQLPFAILKESSFYVGKEGLLVAMMNPFLTQIKGVLAQLEMGSSLPH